MSVEETKGDNDVYDIATATVEGDIGSEQRKDIRGTVRKPLYQCHKCGKTFRKEAYAKDHCNKPNWWRCDKCGQKIVNRQNVKRHITRCNKQRGKTTIPTEKPLFRCVVCGELFASNSNSSSFF